MVGALTCSAWGKIFIGYFGMYWPRNIRVNSKFAGTTLSLKPTIIVSVSVGRHVRPSSILRTTAFHVDEVSSNFFLWNLTLFFVAKDITQQNLRPQVSLYFRWRILSKILQQILEHCIHSKQTKWTKKRQIISPYPRVEKPTLKSNDGLEKLNSI